MSTTIEILPYRPDWRDDYARIAAIIRPIAPKGARLHHIGSTAVPGLAAKDVIDLQLTVETLADVDIAVFVAAGFIHRPGLADHAPPGIDVPEHDLAKLFFKATDRAANLHVRERGRFNQRYALLCRDYLRAHAGATRAYEAVKRGLARHFPDDADSYYEIKDPVFDIIMAGAESWAEHSGWQESLAD